MGHLLYKKAFCGSENAKTELNIKEFVPKIGKLFLKSEKKGLRDSLSRLNFWLDSKGKAKIYYVIGEDGSIAHTSYVIPHCSKFPFMGENDYEIGPCMTAPEFRGRGIYPSVLNHITSLDKYRGAEFYMIVRDDNQSSVRGIEKAGFVRCGKVEKTGLLKKYRLIEDTTE